MEALETPPIVTITESEALDIAPKTTSTWTAVSLPMLIALAGLNAPTGTLALDGAAGATVSFKTVVADEVDVLPARSVCESVSVSAAPSAKVEALTVAVDVAPGFTESELDMAVVMPSEILATAESLADAPAGHVIDTETAAALNVLITFAALLAPEATTRVVGFNGATISFVALVPETLAVLPAVSVKAIDIDTEPSASDDALIVLVVEPDGFGLADVAEADALPSESVTT